MRFLTAGTSAMLIELGDLDSVIHLHEALRRDPPPGAVELVPAACTLLVTFDPGRTTRERLVHEISGREGTAGRPQDQRLVEIPVVYDGPDLTEVARLSGLSTREVVLRHSQTRYTYAFCGFAPGFAYLTGLDPALHLPRRPVPRTRVAPGSVAMADQFTSVYPSESPGGWHLLGHTTAVLWDTGRQPPSLLTLGTQVQFVPVKQ